MGSMNGYQGGRGIERPGIEVETRCTTKEKENKVGEKGRSVSRRHVFKREWGEPVGELKRFGDEGWCSRPGGVHPVARGETESQSRSARWEGIHAGIGEEAWRDTTGLGIEIAGLWLRFEGVIFGGAQREWMDGSDGKQKFE